RWRRIVDAADIGHATLGVFAAGSLLPCAAGIQRDVGDASSFTVPMPTPAYIRSEGDALALQPREALAHVFGGPLAGGLGQTHTGHLLKELTGFVEAVADTASQSRQLFGGRRQAMLVDAGLLVKGAQALAAASAVIIGALTRNLAAQTEETLRAVAVISSGVVAVRAGYAGSLVAVFFESSCWR